MASNRERRNIGGTVQTRAEGETRTLTGYAAVFNQRTSIMGLFDEQIAPGAFAEAIGRDDVRALFNHDPNYVLGRTSSNTLRLVEDEQGLRYDIDPPDTQAGRDVSHLIARGDVQGSSFSFEVISEDWNHKATPPMRTITKVKLHDVGPVTFPAYEQTTVSARALTEAQRADVDTLSREISRWKLASIA